MAAKKKTAKKKTRTVKIGMLGCGRAGFNMHYNELKNRTAKFEVVAACDILAAHRERAEKGWGARGYADIAEFLADPEVELVVITTRSCDHVEHTRMAMAAGKDVFLEKPISLTYDEAKKLKSYTKRYRTKLYVRHNRFWEPGFQHVREIIASGKLGEVYEIKLRRTQYQLRDDWQTIKRYGGGQLLNWGPHILHHAVRFIDGKIKNQYSYLRKVAAAGDAEDHLKIVLEGTNGLLVDVEISGGTAIKEPVYFVQGDRGALLMPPGEKEIQLRYIDPRQKIPQRKANTGTPQSGFGGTPVELKWIEKTIAVKKKPTTDDIYDDLYDAIRNGKPFPISLEESLEVMRIISKAKEGTKFDVKPKAHTAKKKAAKKRAAATRKAKK